MAPTPLHRLKLQRAEQHLRELDALAADLRKRRSYPVSETFDPKRGNWVYSLSLHGIEPPETFPIVLADVLSNTRSALDHQAVATAPKPSGGGRQRLEAPEGRALAILSALQNADRQGSLIAVISALEDPVLAIDGKAWDVSPSLTISPTLKNGAELYVASKQAVVEIEGSATIEVGRPDELWDCAEFLRALGATMADGVLPRLEPLLPAARERTGS